MLNTVYIAFDLKQKETGPLQSFFQEDHLQEIQLTYMRLFSI